MDMREAGRLGAIASKPYTDALRAKRLAEYSNAPRLCLHCGKVIPYKKKVDGNKYCNRACKGLYQRNANARKRVIKKCIRCGGPINGWATRFCSHNCSAKYRHDQKMVQIETLGYVPSFNGGWDNRKSARAYLFKKFGQTCSLCSNSLWQGKPIPLIVDHIDGNSDNNVLTNLRLVCPNCDAQLPTYKGRNKGKGRICRRQRYHFEKKIMKMPV